MEKEGRVKNGDTVIINSITYIFDEMAAKNYNIWADLLEYRDTDVTIYLFTADGGGRIFLLPKIKEALEKAEKIDWNKTAHGL